jgi:tetratricopeptide (TPR) repeat protein
MGAIDTAVRLAPDDPGVIEGLGDYYYYGYRDYARATEQYMRLAQMRPNDPVMFYSLGLIQRREGRMEDAIPNFRQGLKLDPNNLQYALEFASSLGAVRHYDEAEALLRRLDDANPHDQSVEFMAGLMAYWARGSTAEMDAIARQKVDPSAQPLQRYIRGTYAVARGDYAEFARVDREQRYYDEDPDNPRWSQDATAAEAFAEAGDMRAAKARAAEALATMKGLLPQQADNSVLWANMSLAQAILGDRDGALQSAQKSADLMPESRDALVGPGNSDTCALAFAWAGDKERALSEIRRLLHVPWGLNIYTSRVSWLPLRGDPRFKALMDDARNNDPIF